MPETVVFEYTDRRLAKGRTITIGPAKVHALLAAGEPLKIKRGAGVYGKWCEAHKVDRLDATPETVPEKVRAEEGDATDGWPDGFTHERTGAMYDVTDPVGESVGRFKGAKAAAEAAWNWTKRALGSGDDGST